MTNSSSSDSDLAEAMSAPAPTAERRRRWTEAVGKVFKLTNKAYGVRTVTYTHMTAIKDSPAFGGFEIAVVCAEITARVIDGKRAHSSVCKEGFIRYDAVCELWPSNFGEECEQREFEKATGAILSYTTTYLDWVMRGEPDEKQDIDATLDLPNFEVTPIEANFLRSSPFLVKDRYYITSNSVQAAFDSINQELQKATRGMRLTDVADPVFVARKDEAVASLRAKLKEALLNPHLHLSGRVATTPDPRDPLAMIHTAPAFPVRTAPPMPKPGAALSADLAPLRLDSITLALMGKFSATRLSWQYVNPSQEGPMYTLGSEVGLLTFVRWAHTSGRSVPETEVAGRALKSYFTGFNNSYTGPDAEGIYPLLKPAA